MPSRSSAEKSVAYRNERIFDEVTELVDKMENDLSEKFLDKIEKELKKLVDDEHAVPPGTRDSLRTRLATLKMAVERLIDGFKQQVEDERQRELTQASPHFNPGAGGGRGIKKRKTKRKTKGKRKSKSRKR